MVVLMRARNASFGIIGDHLGVTRQRARELFLKALRRAPFLAGDLAFSYAAPAVEIPATLDAAAARKRAAAHRRRLLVEKGRQERQKHIPLAPNQNLRRKPLPAGREIDQCTLR
jgi:hypothetical protein